MTSEEARNKFWEKMREYNVVYVKMLTYCLNVMTVKQIEKAVKYMEDEV